MAKRNQHLIELRASNFMRLKAVEIKVDPDNPKGIIILTGKNGAGKSAVLNAISAGFQGKKYVPKQPIRKGSTRGEVLLTTEDFVVTRTFTAGGSAVHVKGREDKRPYSEPQALLDGLCEEVGFDPLSFARMKTKPQGEKLLEICPVDIDLGANAKAQDVAFERRTDATRELKRLEVVVAALPEADAETPEEEVSVKGLLEEAKALRDAKESRRKIEIDIAQAEINNEANEAELAELQATIAKAQAELVAAQARLAKAPDVTDDLAKTEAKIADADRLNMLYRAKVNRISQEDARDLAKADAETADKQLEGFRAQRAEAFQRADFGIDGLAVDEAGEVMYNGVPFSQAATSEQIKVGVTLAAKANPRLRLMFVRDGSLLDADSMMVLAEMAELHDLQPLIERVDDDSPAAIEIVDGSTVTPEE